MRTFAFVASVLVPLTISMSPLLAAEDAVPTTNAEFDARLKSFDPRAVAAAQHYFGIPSVKSGLLQMQSITNQGIKKAVLQQRPDLTPDEIDNFIKDTGQIAAERFDLFLKVGMVAQLETLSTDEIVALDRFYSSPEGASILAKTPQMATRLSAMMQAIVPDAVNEMKSKMKPNGAGSKP